NQRRAREDRRRGWDYVAVLLGVAVYRASKFREGQPPEDFPPGQSLLDGWRNAQNDPQRVQTVLGFFDALLGAGTTRRIATPPNPATKGKATELAKDLGLALATYRVLREVFQKRISAVEICCTPTGSFFDLIKTTLRVFP